MPSYQVLEPGFYAGKSYSPVGKRTILSTTLPFKVVPSWLKEINESEEARIAREKFEVEQTNEANEKKINQLKEGSPGTDRPIIETVNPIKNKRRK